MKCCELHKNGKYKHWPCGKYDPLKRRKIYLSHPSICKVCGGKCSQFNNKCIKCKGREQGDKRRGIKLPEIWRQHISDGQRREKGNNWKGGITTENKRIRSNIKFKEWREKVFIRDNWTCRECGIRGGELHPHHIKELSQNKDLVYYVENGITLCKNCHQKKHCKNLTTNRPKHLKCFTCGIGYKPKSRSTWRNGAKRHFCSRKCLGKFQSVYYKKVK
jgi:5-methylcytosine-specific restriction endonuclease McrA